MNIDNNGNFNTYHIREQTHDKILSLTVTLDANNKPPEKSRDSEVSDHDATLQAESNSLNL